MSKKLLICSPSHAVRGGVEATISDLCRELPNRGWETILALGKGTRFNDVQRYRETYRNLPIIEVDGTAGTRQARINSLSRVITKVCPDIVLSARIYDVYPAIASLKGKKTPIRLAITIQGFEPQYIYDARLHRDVIDLCATSGNMLREVVVRWSGLAGERVVNIPGGVRPPAFPSMRRQSRKPLRIGYVGRLADSDKRVLDIVPLIKQLEELSFPYHLRIVGAGPEELLLREKLSKQISEAKIVIEGWMSREELYRDVYPMLDCVVSFSASEGVTIAGREAMVNGVVPVTSRFIGLKVEGQYVHEVNSLTFPVGDINEAVKGLYRLAEEPGLLEKLSTNAMRSQSGKYTLSGSMDTWAESFNRCLEQPPSMGCRPQLAMPRDGRLTRIGLPPRTAQFLRDLVGRQHVHTDPGSEWPTGSGLMTEESARQIMQFAGTYEAEN